MIAAHHAQRLLVAAASAGAIAAGIARPRTAPPILEVPVSVATSIAPARSAEVDELAALHGDELRLAQLWRARHPSGPLPRCDHRDPLAVLRADVDASPGRERVIADRRYGIAMFDADGALLATADLGCAGWPDEVGGDQAVHLEARRLVAGPHRQLIARIRTVAHCGEFKTMTAFARRGRELDVILDLDLGGERACGISEWSTSARVAVPRPGVVVVRLDGRERRMIADRDAFAPWTRRHERCTLRANRDGKLWPVDAASREACPQPFDECDAP